MIKKLDMPESIEDGDVMSTFEVQLENKLNQVIDKLNSLEECGVRALGCGGCKLTKGHEAEHLCEHYSDEPSKESATKEFQKAYDLGVEDAIKEERERIIEAVKDLADNFLYYKDSVPFSEVLQIVRDRREG